MRNYPCCDPQRGAVAPLRLCTASVLFLFYLISWDYLSLCHPKAKPPFYSTGTPIPWPAWSVSQTEDFSGLKTCHCHQSQDHTPHWHPGPRSYSFPDPRDGFGQCRQPDQNVLYSKVRSRFPGCGSLKHHTLNSL